jgi:isoleucyl-tRNA synthetase
LLASVAAEGRAPFKDVLTHGFVMFAKGVKMSKSQGNVVDPADIIKQKGAEMLRLWAAHEDYSQDLGCSPESFERLTETYRKIRNTMRFLLGTLDDFDFKSQAVNYESMLEIDQWALHRLNSLIEKVTDAYEKYEFYKIYHLLNNYFTVDLSAIYLDVLKDRLYTSKLNGLPRKSAQTVLYHQTQSVIGLMAPILSFLAEESFDFFKGKDGDSVFLTDFPTVSTKWNRVDLEEKYSSLLGVREKVSKVLEEIRVQKTIGSSLEAQVDLSFEGKTFENLKSIEKQLPSFFIVSQVTLKNGPENVQARKADGKKCVRCWHFSPKIGENAEHPELCPKCIEALG